MIPMLAMHDNINCVLRADESDLKLGIGATIRSSFRLLMRLAFSGGGRLEVNTHTNAASVLTVRKEMQSIRADPIDDM